VLGLALGVRVQGLASGLGVKVRVSFRVYLFCLLVCFCQACCCWHLGEKIDTAYFLLQKSNPN